MIATERDSGSEVWRRRQQWNAESKVVAPSHDNRSTTLTFRQDRCTSESGSEDRDPNMTMNLECMGSGRNHAGDAPSDVDRDAG